MVNNSMAAAKHSGYGPWAPSEKNWQETGEGGGEEMEAGGW